MTLSAEEFMRRFLLHVLPGRFDRIRHYGLLANAGRREHLAQARELFGVFRRQAKRRRDTGAGDPAPPTFVCPHCGAVMSVVDVARLDPRPTYNACSRMNAGPGNANHRIAIRRAIADSGQSLHGGTAIPRWLKRYPRLRRCSGGLAPRREALGRHIDHWRPGAPAGVPLNAIAA